MSFSTRVSALLADVLLEEVHQGPDLEPRALPVLDREGVEGEHLELQPGGGLDRVAHRGDAGPVPLDARQAAPLGPAAVAVHDDGDVPGQPGEVDPADEQLFGRARVRELGEIDHGGQEPLPDALKYAHRPSPPAIPRAPLGRIEHPFQHQPMGRGGGARPPRAAGRRAARRSSRASACPGPTSIRVPTRARTMPRRKPSPATGSAAPRPPPPTPAAKMRAERLAVGAAGQGEGGEVVPAGQAGGRRGPAAPRSTRRATRTAKGASSGREHGGAAQPVAVLLARGVLPGVEARRASARRRAPARPRAGGGWCRGPARARGTAPASSRWAAWPRAWTPASVRLAPDRRAPAGRGGAPERLLQRPAAPSGRSPAAASRRRRAPR